VRNFFVFEPGSSFYDQPIVVISAESVAEVRAKMEEKMPCCNNMYEGPCDGCPRRLTIQGVN
jgi:hypothetical protein